MSSSPSLWSPDPVADACAPGREGPRSRAPDLIRMANQIAANRAHHRPAQAAGEVAQHLKSFWTPGMLKELNASAANGGEELHPLVTEALALMSRELG